MVRRVSNESQASGTSVYSDALDDLTSEQRRSNTKNKSETQER